MYVGPPFRVESGPFLVELSLLVGSILEMFYSARRLLWGITVSRIIKVGVGVG